MCFTSENLTLKLTIYLYNFLNNVGHENFLEKVFLLFNLTELYSLPSITSFLVIHTLKSMSEL